MAERLVVRVNASPSHANGITVEDAFNQVLDLFELAKEGEADPDRLVAWRLVSATMQSPFTIVAEAVSVVPLMNVDSIARAQKVEFVRNLEQLNHGVVPRAWSRSTLRRRATFVYARNMNGIGRTDVSFQPGETDFAEVVVTPDTAAVAVHALTDDPAHRQEEIKDQIGSVEGVMQQVGTHYNKPAILVRERKTGAEFWCVVTEEFRARIAAEANFDDVWSGRRVVVHGLISYNDVGEIARVTATEVHRVIPTDVPLEKLRDPEFTGGLSVTDYLEKLREGDLG